jgi:CBS domain-containing protein
LLDESAVWEQCKSSGIADDGHSGLDLRQEDAMHVTDPIRSVLEYKGHDVFSVDPQASVYEAIELMADREIGALLVMSEGKLVGLISERDYARKIILKGRLSRQTRVEEVMSSPVVCASPGDTVDDCMRIMTQSRIRHLPVADGGRILGVVSIGDLVNWIITAQAETIGHLHSYIAGTYPG